MASILDRVPFPGKRGRDPEPDNDIPEGPESFGEMTLQEHLEELRTRMLYSSIAILIALVAGLVLSFPVLDLVGQQAQVPDEGMQTINPTEGFVTFFKVAIYIAVALAMPVLIYQLVRFVAPGLTRNERTYVFRAIPFVVFFFVSGVAFAFFIVVPRALDYLSGFGSNVFNWDPTADSLVSFYMRLMIGIGIVFELPPMLFILAKIGVVNHKQLGRVRKFAFLLCMVAAAIITPTPDPFNMMLVAIPMYFLYEFGTFMTRFAKPDRDRQQAA
jgi:sec-independent protein translocase protein TatC